jgi:hypothetical protein
MYVWMTKFCIHLLVFASGREFLFHQFYNFWTVHKQVLGDLRLQKHKNSVIAFPKLVFNLMKSKTFTSNDYTFTIGITLSAYYLISLPHHVFIIVRLLDPTESRHPEFGLDVAGAVGELALECGESVQVEGQVVEARGQCADLTVRQHTATHGGGRAVLLNAHCL